MTKKPVVRGPKFLTKSPIRHIYRSRARRTRPAPATDASRRIRPDPKTGRRAGRRSRFCRLLSLRRISKHQRRLRGRTGSATVAARFGWQYRIMALWESIRVQLSRTSGPKSVRRAEGACELPGRVKTCWLHIEKWGRLWLSPPCRTSSWRRATRRRGSISAPPPIRIMPSTRPQGATSCCAFMRRLTTVQGQAAIAGVLANRALFDDERMAFFGVSIDPRDESEGRVRDTLPGIRYFWDFDGAVSARYGAIPLDTKLPQSRVSVRQFWLVLDPTLRVMRRFSLCS